MSVKPNEVSVLNLLSLRKFALLGSKTQEILSLNFVGLFSIIKFYVMPVHSALPVLPDLSTYLETVSLFGYILFSRALYS